MLIKKVEVIGEEPVTLPEAKNFLRIDFEEDNSYIDSLIATAREHIETISNIVLIEKEISIKVEDADSELKLPFEPFSQVVSVIDEEGADISDYEIETDYEGEARISFSTEQIFPVDVVYRSGFDLIPRPLWQAILILVSHLYDNRQIFVSGRNVNEIDFTLKALIAPHKRWSR